MKPPVNILHFFTRKKSRENFKLPDAILLRTALTLSLTFHQHHKMMQTLETRRVKCARNSTSNCTYQHRCFLCVIMTQGKGFLPPDSHQQNVEQQQVVYWFCLNLCRNHWHRVHLDFYWIDISIKVNWALPLTCTLPWCLSSFLLFHSCFLFLTPFPRPFVSLCFPSVFGLLQDNVSPLWVRKDEHMSIWSSAPVLFPLRPSLHHFLRLLTSLHPSINPSFLLSLWCC